jgi:predicted PurR-regulated permease PerM
MHVHEPAERQPEAPQPGAQPVRDPEPVMVPRWIQLVMLPLGIVGLYELVRAAGPVLLIFIIGALIALLLNPAVSMLRRAGLPRGVSVFLVFLVLLLVLAGIGALLANPIGNQVSDLQRNVPAYIRDANHSLENFQAWLDRHNIHAQIAEPGRSALATIGDRITHGSGSLVRFTKDVLTTVVQAAFAVVLVIVLSIYMLLYAERMGAAVRRLVPRGDGSREDDFPTQIQKAVTGYVRGQLLFSGIMGLSAGIMLWILGSVGIFPEGKSYALFFGLWMAFAELIPYIGPILGAAPPVLIALLSSHPIDAVWLVIGFAVLQQLEGHVVAPNVFAQALRINPILVMFALLLGAELYGIIGALVALPIAAMLRATVIYFRRHLVLEPWPRVSLAGVGVGVSNPGPPGSPPGMPPEAQACVECGANLPEGAAFCPACGTERQDPGAHAAATSAAPG